MITAIFVYESTPINFSTDEIDVQLCCMGAEEVSLANGNNARTIGPGIYKIVSSHEVKITGDFSAFEVITNTKTNDPTPPPLRAIASFAPLDTAALHTFMTLPEAKVAVNP